MQTIKDNKKTIITILSIALLAFLIWKIFPVIIKTVQKENEGRIQELRDSIERNNEILDSLRWQSVFAKKKEAEWRIKYDSIEQVLTFNKKQYEATIDSIANRTSDQLNNVIDGAINDALNEWGRQLKSKSKKSK